MVTSVYLRNPSGAVRVLYPMYPWNGPEAADLGAERAGLPFPTEQEVAVCMVCEHCAAACERCDGAGHLRRETGGRPRADVDLDELREMLKLKLCNRQMCAALGVSNATLGRLKKQAAG